MCFSIMDFDLQLARLFGKILNQQATEGFTGAVFIKPLVLA